MFSSTLKSKINQLWDKFWSRGITNPITAIEQISYLLFIRRLDELDTSKIVKSEFTRENYHSLFKGKFKLNPLEPEEKETPGNTIDKQKLRWSQFKQLDPEAMLERVTKFVFPFIKNLQGEEQPYSRSMQNAVFLITSPLLLDEAVKAIDEIYEEIKKQQDQGQEFQDTQGDVYEYLLNELAQAGKNGQFRTPRHIIQLIAEIVDPDITDRICDPACGTGGFLLGAYQHILTKYTSPEHLHEDENGFKRGTLGDRITKDQVWKKLKEKTFYGFDIDQTMVRIGLMNLILHDISVPKIEHMDTLSKKYDSYEGDEQYSVVMANPPFTGRIATTDMSDKFRIGRPQTELLFIDRMIHMLKPGGKAGVIVPEGVLFGSSKANIDIRKALLMDCQLEAVISLPAGVFKPYTGVKTAILVFTKVELKAKKFHTEKVWFYELLSDGYSLDDNRKKLMDNPLPHAVDSYKEKLRDDVVDRTSQHFYVPVSEIKENDFDLTFDGYKALHYQEEEYEPPKDLLKKLLECEKEIKEGMEELNRMIQ